MLTSHDSRRRGETPRPTEADRVTHHEKTAHTTPTIRLVSEGMERALQQPQQPPTEEKVTWATSRKMAAQTPSPSAGFCG